MRHRFMRALGQSFLAFLFFILLLLPTFWLARLVLQLFGGDPLGPETQWVAMWLGVTLGAAALGLIVWSLYSAIYDAIYRRLTAVVWLLLCAGIGVGVCPLAYSVWQIVELELNGVPAIRLVGPEAFWSRVGAILLLLPFLYEVIAWAWWQYVLEDELFYAARGWRPSPWRFMSNLRRRLGLPAFLSAIKRKGGWLSFGYFWVAVLNANIFLLIMAVELMIPRPAEQQLGSPLATLIIAILAAAILGINLLGGGRALARLLNERASWIYQDVREWDQRQPIVFLRGFKQDRATLEPQAKDPLVRSASGIGAERTLDELLIEHASPYGPPIAIGDPNDKLPPLGAARIFVSGAGDDWQGVVTDLVGASRAIVMCPTSSAGVQWELDLLARTNANQRTIFLASPTLSDARVAELFRNIPVGLETPPIGKDQTPIAAYMAPGAGWRLLTTRHRSLESYSLALNISLRGLLGAQGVPIQQPRRRKPAIGTAKPAGQSPPIGKDARGALGF